MKKAIICVALIAMAVFSSYVSYVNFKVANPISTAVGLCKVILTDTDYVVVKEHPKVVFVKPDYLLETYMENQGYKEDAEKRDFSLRIFSSGDSEITIHHSYNNVYGMWHWQD